MEDCLRSLRSLRNRGQLADIAFDEPHAGTHIRPMARGEVIENRHLIPAAQEQIDDVRSDESGTAGHENFHETKLAEAGGEETPAEGRRYPRSSLTTVLLTLSARYSTGIRQSEPWESTIRTLDRM